MKHVKLFGFVLLVVTTLASCSTASKLKKANAMYESGGYYKAAGMYQQIAGKVDPKDRPTVNFRIGECYRILGNLSLAETAYGRLVRSKTNPINEAYLRMGEVLLMGKKFDMALEAFKAYKQLAPDDGRADIGIESCELAKSQVGKNNDYIVENFTAVNSQFNDYAPAYGTADYEMLLFTSSRSDGSKSKKRQAGTGQRPSSIYYTQQGKKGWERPKVLGPEVNGKRDEDGAPCFNSSYDKLYFTKSTVSMGEFTDGCNIFVATRDENYNWIDAELIDAPDSLMMAHPSISEDGLTIYFASNMPGGYGGRDIWKMTRKSVNSGWDSPINLGSQVNTKDDEVFPFIRANGELYFASNGHPGYGGLDLFKAAPTESGSWIVENMGPTFNTEADDFAIIFEAKNNQGYFSSRRKGGKGGDDIYRFYKNIPVIEYYLEGVVLNADTRKPIAASELKLTGNNGSVLIKKTEGDGKFSFKLNNNTDYICIASANGFLNQKALLSTMGYTQGHTFRDTMLMVSTAKPIEIPNIFYEYGKANLNSQSREALDKLVDLMRDNPDIVVELAAHTDSRGTNESNLDLSQRRAQAVVDYLVREGIDEDRMYAKGYGEEEPKSVDRAIADKYTFLSIGRKLTEAYINTMRTEEQKEICHQLNRRTELIVLNSKELQRK